MKKTFAMLIGAAAAIALSAFSAAAADITVDTRSAVETADGTSFTVNSNKLSLAQFGEDSTLTVTCEGGEGEECPFRLMLDYWDRKSNDAFDFGAPLMAEVPYKEYKDGTAVYTYDDLTKVLGEVTPDMVFAMEIVPAGASPITCKSVEAANVLSANEMAENNKYHTTWVHTADAKPSKDWHQSVSVGVDRFDTSTLTPDSYVIVRYELDATDTVYSDPVEFILQSTDDKVSPKAKNGTVWAKVAPMDFNNSFAYFNYKSIVDAYGTDDFSCVYTVYVGDTGQYTMTCTDIYIMNCKTLAVDEPEPPAESKSEDSSAAETATAAETSSASEMTSAAESAAASSAAAAATSSEGDSSIGSHVVFIIIGVVAGVVIAGVAVFIILGRKSNKTYDISRRRFVKKK